MSRVTIKPSVKDSLIFNEYKFSSDIALAMSTNKDILVDIGLEGPDLKLTNFYDILEYNSKLFNYDIGRIDLITQNVLERSKKINIHYLPPLHFSPSYKPQNSNIIKKKFNHFGIFVGRNNGPRLMLSSHINNLNKNNIQTFHFNVDEDFDRANLALDELFFILNKKNIESEVSFINCCPIKYEKMDEYPIPEDAVYDGLEETYEDFFVEIVCESFYNGETFFPTEKIWRPMFFRTPFIVQGPSNYLSNLHRLGFKTFHEFWNEEYDEEPYPTKLNKIVDVIDYINSKTKDELNTMYENMQDILDHNQKLVMKLQKQDFKIFYE